MLLGWAAGSVVAALRRARAGCQAWAARRASDPLDCGRVAEAFARLLPPHGGPRVALRRTALSSSPCVAGVIRPTLLWPDDVDRHLTDAQLEAILAHELAHVRRRDNVMSAAHAMVEVLFWFHPLVWWLGARLTDERERACDDDVLRSMDVAPDVYADGILKVCETAIGAPIASAAAITSSPLIHRIEAIMTSHHPRALRPIHRVLLVIATIALAAVPLAAGALTKPPVQGPSRSITGVVTDQRGGTIAGATVVARGQSGVARSAVSDDNGRYTVTDVPPGPIELRVSHSGFRTYAVTISASSALPGASIPFNIQLQIGSISEQVTLRAPATGAEDSAAAALRQAELQTRVAQAADPVAAELALAELYYRQERFAESEAAMARAADLIAQRAAAQRAATAGTPDFVVTYPRGGAITEPRKIRDVKPIYPEIARQAKVSGVVVIEAKVAEDGTVRDARILRSIPLLDAAALGAVSQWLFTPTKLNGVPIEVVITATVHFLQ
jgi:TonB family protein